MSFLHLSLDLAALVLWLSWRSLGFREVVPYRSTLIHTLKSAGPGRVGRWRHLAGLGALLFLRALLYRQLGSAVSWVPQLDLQLISLPFQSAQPWRMPLFSLLSFAHTLGVFYLCLLSFSIVNRTLNDQQPFQRLVRLHLGFVDRWPIVLKLLLPPLIGLLGWLSLHPLLEWLGLIPAGASARLAIEQGLVLGLFSCLVWKYVFIGVLALQVVQSYVYLGRSPLWDFIDATARRLTRPLARLPLRAGKVDFAPAAAIALVLVCARLLELGLPQLFRRLPL